VSLPRDLLRDHPDLGEWCVLSGYRGSIAHGTYVPATDDTGIDDKDVMAFCVPPLDHYYGLAEFHSRGTHEIVSERDKTLWDIVVYEIRKALRLLKGGNPNVLSMLWLPDNLYLKRTSAGQLLIDRREVFVGRHVYRSFTGYAVAQLRKMEAGQYKGWMGDKRKALVERFGYDTKNASHLIRLLRQGIEFLNDGELYVVRHDASELVAIKRGEWTLERVKTEAERLFARADEAYDRSKLPAKPDQQAVNDLCVQIVSTAQSSSERDNG
jgi:uncharacterized protein